MQCTATLPATVPLRSGLRCSLACARLRRETSLLSAETISSPALCEWCRHLGTALCSSSCGRLRPLVSAPQRDWIHSTMSLTLALLRLSPSEAPSFVDERAKRFGRVVIAATNPAKWQLR